MLKCELKINRKRKQAEKSRCTQFLTWVLSFSFSFLGTHQRTGTPLDVWDVNTAMSWDLDKRCYQVGVLLLPWLRREMRTAGSSPGSCSSPTLPAEVYRQTSRLVVPWGKVSRSRTAPGRTTLFLRSQRTTPVLALRLVQSLTESSTSHCSPSVKLIFLS